MKAPLGPRAQDLQALKDWAQLQSFRYAELPAVVAQTLQALGCKNVDDVQRYATYLLRLMQGEHIALVGLSLQALQQVDSVLLAWRRWLLAAGELPACLESVLIDSLDAAQAVLLERIAARYEGDHATGLPDRTALPKMLVQGALHTQEDRVLALMFLEITSGPHAYPDALLSLVAERLAHVLRQNDALLLIDRQSFGLVLANLNGEGHALLAAHRALACFETPLQLNHESVVLHPRIGIALMPDHGDTAEQLLSAAGVAARNYATDGDGVYDPSRDRLNYALKKLETPLRIALQENLLSVAFQPQICCRSGDFYGVESLLRWHDDKLGDVRTDELVMVADHLGLMGTLTHWVLNASLREYAKLLALGVPGTISINLAPANLRDRELPAAIQDAFAVWQVPPERVILEITESALIENIDDALESLHKLKSLGCQLALDDFGTGYSSLSYLKRLPIDELKIDRSFIVTMRESEKDAGIVRAIIEMAHLLGQVVVTEGVEDATTAQMLTAMGNDVIQGYLYSKAIPPADIPAFIERHTKTL